MLQHFNECIKSAKSGRQQAVQMNIFTAVLCALKSLADTKTTLGPDDVKTAAFNLILKCSSGNCVCWCFWLQCLVYCLLIGCPHSTNPILRCAAGEALGRMAQVVGAGVGDTKFIAEMAQYSFDRLKSARDVVSRTGNSLALGCLHRYVGGMGSGQHLNTSVSILLALAQDFNSPVVQVWALHALALIADSGGPMFRGYVEPTLSLVLQLLLSVPPSAVDVHQCLGKCLAALITSIGPELQGNSSSIATARLSCLVCCAIMQDHPRLAGSGGGHCLSTATAHVRPTPCQLVHTRPTSLYIRGNSTHISIPSRKLDFLWMVTHALGLERIPLWTGFNAWNYVDHLPKQVMLYMPNIDRSPTNNDVVAETLSITQKCAQKCGQAYGVVTYDLDVATRANKIQITERPKIRQHLHYVRGISPTDMPL
ncbi:hypothetical protein ScPMuIL_007333 [Solemya velum]